MRERIVYFDFDSFIIRAEARPIIEAHGRRLRADDKLRVALEGHTDDRGGREYNLGLGQKRADAVRKALSLMGVADSQMEAVSFGKEKPAVPGNTEAAMQENRRVEINYRWLIEHHEDAIFRSFGFSGVAVSDVGRSGLGSMLRSTGSTF